MKRFLVIVMLVLVPAVSFAIYPVSDASVLYQTILEKMGQAEHFVKEIQQFKNVLLHYERQYEQIKTYYEQLAGIMGRFEDAQTFIDYWNNTKLMLEKLQQISQKRGEIETALFNDGIRLMNENAKVAEWTREMAGPDNDFSKAITAKAFSVPNQGLYYGRVFMASIRHNAEAMGLESESLSAAIEAQRYNIDISEKALELLESEIQAAKRRLYSYEYVMSGYRDEYRTVLNQLTSLTDVIEEYEQKNMELYRNPDKGATEGQRSEALNLSLSFRSQYELMKTKLETIRRNSAYFNSQINALQDTLDDLENTRDKWEFNKARYEERYDKYMAIDLETGR